MYLYVFLTEQYEKKILARDAMKQLAVEEEEKAKAKRLTHLKDEIHNTKMAIHRWKVCHWRCRHQQHTQNLLCWLFISLQQDNKVRKTITFKH